MCQKSLPHAHSDTVIQGRHGSASEPQFHSFHSDEVARPWQAHHRVLPVPVLSEGLVEWKEEQPLGIDLGKHGFQGAEGGAQLGVPVFSVPAPQHEYRTHTALPLDVQAPYGMYLTTTNLPQMCHEHMLHHPPLASTEYQKKPVSVADVNPVRSEASAPESATRDPVTEFIGKHPAFIPREGVPSLAVLHEHVRPINAMMETLHVSPPELNVRPNIVKQEGLPVVVESGVHLTEPAYTSSAVKIAARDDVREVRSQDDASANPAIVHPPHLSQVGSLHCPLPGDPPQMVYQHFEPLRPKVISGQPVLSCANSAQNTVNLIPVREPNNEVSQFYSRNIHNGSVIPKSSNLPSSLVLSGITNELLGNIQEPASSGTAPLSNGDPWKTLPTTNFQSVKPIKVATSAELLTAENHWLRTVIQVQRFTLKEEVIICLQI
ncbi:hypothetical protein QJS10_CPB17g02144 [Acorus calamus]|uniref:Uncharacterized protein n=1 Tax=Acorus calamus TaxID=4465 RepID=A0AAV9CUA4_ACOCL|nr:hypothetical protein QJS10_CPB17g02144 [Acorus calamus]